MQVPEDLREGRVLVKLCQPLHERLSLSLVSRVKEVEKPLSDGFWTGPAFEGFSVAFIASFDVRKRRKSTLYFGAQATEID